MKKKIVNDPETFTYINGPEDIKDYNINSHPFYWTESGLNAVFFRNELAGPSRGTLTVSVPANYLKK